MGMLRAPGWDWLSIPLPLPLDGLTGTPRRFFHSLSSSQGQVLCRCRFFDERKDRFLVSPSSEDSLDIALLQLQPWLWVDMSIFEAVLFPPSEPL